MSKQAFHKLNFFQKENKFLEKKSYPFEIFKEKEKLLTLHINKKYTYRDYITDSEILKILIHLEVF